VAQSAWNPKGRGIHGWRNAAGYRQITLGRQPTRTEQSVGPNRLSNVTSSARHSSSPDRAAVSVHVHSCTDTGLAREHNEDAFIVADLTQGRGLEGGVASRLSAGERGLLFMVADGMGGAAAGEVASRMATELVFERLKSRTEPWLGDRVAFVAALHDAAEYANEEIHNFAFSNPGHDGMGTTATIAGLLGDTLYLAQVGDSRAYLVRNGEARQLTKDQSLIQKLVEFGEITQEEAERSERRNIILQALGPEESVVIDLTRQQVRRGDVLVLCSDGLSGIVKREELVSILESSSTLRDACNNLIARANELGGPDNITVILVRFDGPGLDQAQPEDDVGYVAFEEAESVRTGELRAAARPSMDQRTRRAPAGERLGTSPVSSFARDDSDDEGSSRRERGEKWMFVLMIALVIVAISVAFVLLD